MTMRGCATSLSRYGFHNRTIAVFDQYDMCREVLANELFRFDTDSQPIEVIFNSFKNQTKNCLLFKEIRIFNFFY